MYNIMFCILTTCLLVSCYSYGTFRADPRTFLSDRFRIHQHAERSLRTFRRSCHIGSTRTKTFQLLSSDLSAVNASENILGSIPENGPVNEQEKVLESDLENIPEVTPENPEIAASATNVISETNALSAEITVNSMEGTDEKATEKTEEETGSLEDETYSMIRDDNEDHSDYNDIDENSENSENSENPTDNDGDEIDSSELMGTVSSGMNENNESKADDGSDQIDNGVDKIDSVDTSDSSESDVFFKTKDMKGEKEPLPYLPGVYVLQLENNAIYVGEKMRK